MDVNLKESFESFLNFFKKDDEESISGWIAFDRFGRHIESLTIDGLKDIIYSHYGKYPNCRNRLLLQQGVKRIFQTLYYKELFGHEISERVKKRDASAINRLDLGDKPPTKPIPAPKNKKEKIRKAKESTRRKKPMDNTEKTKLSVMINKMTLDQIIGLAAQCEVPKESIQRFKTKPLGLAKMGLGNMIRSRVGKDPKHQHLLDKVPQSPSPTSEK